MMRKRAKLVDQTSFGTPIMTETPGALRSPPVASGEPRRLLSSAPFQSSSGECRVSRVASLWRRYLLTTLLVCGSLAVSLLLLEVGLRLFLFEHSPLNLDIYRLDEHGLLGLRPGVTRRQVSPEWDVTVTINAEGLRDRSKPVLGRNGLILAVGDSMQFGWGVELSQSYLYLVEEGLASDSVRVVKAGIPGTGTSDQARWLQAYGNRYSPRLVIVSFFVGNDFVDCQMGGVPQQFTVQHGLMVRRTLDNEGGFRLSEVTDWLKRSSMVAQLTAQLVWTLQQRFIPAKDRRIPGLTAQDKWLWEFFKIHLRELPPETKQGIDLGLAALDEIHGWAEQRGIPVLLIVIPRSFQVFEWDLAKFLDAYRLTNEQLDLDRPQRVLREWASARSVSVLDLLPGFREYHRAHPDDLLYHHPDSHLNVNGHRLAGALVLEYLRRHPGFADATAVRPVPGRQ
jgi:hypothetical protein